MTLPQTIGLCWFASEMGVLVFKRSKRRPSRSADRGTLRLIWISIAVGVVLAMNLPRWTQSLGFVLAPMARFLALALFVAGAALRWWAILALGRFFTVDVAIHDDHELVTRGPFALVRHPSYTGALVAFLGWSLTFENVASIAGLLVPVTAAMVYRVHVEERALASAFGERWRAYCATTQRLVPGIY